MADKIHALKKDRVTTLCGLDTRTHDIQVTTIPRRVSCLTCKPLAKDYWQNQRQEHRDARDIIKGDPVADKVAREIEIREAKERGTTEIKKLGGN